MEFANIRHVRTERRAGIAFEAYTPRKPSKGDESRWTFLGIFKVPLGTPVRDFSRFVREQMPKPEDGEKSGVVKLLEAMGDAALRESTPAQRKKLRRQNNQYGG